MGDASAKGRCDRLRCQRPAVARPECEGGISPEPRTISEVLSMMVWAGPRSPASRRNSSNDDGRVQRFRTVHHGSGRSGATTTETTELWDFGVPVDDLDWSRLPAFRTSLTR